MVRIFCNSVPFHFSDRIDPDLHSECKGDGLQALTSLYRHNRNLKKVWSGMKWYNWMTSLEPNYFPTSFIPNLKTWNKIGQKVTSFRDNNLPTDHEESQLNTYKNRNGEFCCLMGWFSFPESRLVIGTFLVDERDIGYAHALFLLGRSKCYRICEQIANVVSRWPQQDKLSLFRPKVAFECWSKFEKKGRNDEMRFLEERGPFPKPIVLFDLGTIWTN